MAEVELQQIGPYAVIDLLRVSSTNNFYLSKHRKKDVVIKRLNIPLTSTEDKEAFLLRAKQLKKLKNRNIVNILDINFDSDYGYLVMEHTPGESLLQRIPAGSRLAPDKVKQYLSPIAGALHYAHLSHTLHCNLQPANLIAGERDLILTEFSLTPPGFSPSLDDDAFAVPYMAPEHLRGEPCPASDQYALAVIAYEWLCGRRPYDATERELLLQQQEKASFLPPRALNDTLSSLIERVLVQALALDPAERFPHTQDFSDNYLRALMGLPLKTADVVRPRPVVPPSPAPGLLNQLAPAATISTPMPITPSSSNGSSVSTPAIPQPAELERTPEPSAESNSSALAPVAPPLFQSDTQPALPKKIPELPKPLAPADSRLLSTISDDLRQGGVLSQSLPGYEERPAQVEMASLVSRALSQNVPAIVEASTGTGKALDVDTPIPTPTGWTRMGDLVVGDFVFDEKGEPTHVIAAFDVMHQRKCYEVVFSDGSSLVADAEHEWVSYTCNELLTAVRGRPNKDLKEQRRDSRAYTLVTTEEMAATLTVGSAKRANHAIAIAGALTLPEANLPIAPYFLGVWLGDGNSHNNQITTADPDLITQIEKDGYAVRSLQSHPYLYAVDDEDGKASSRWKPGMTGRLRTLGVLRNKHIPILYLRASEQQRSALLAGLLDTDGTVNHCGAAEFTTTSLQLAQDVYELVCSLGLRASLCHGQARLNGKDCGPKWTIAFTMDKPVFRPGRKVAAHKEWLRSYTPERNLFRYVVAVREVPSRPVRCIQVEAPSHLYLAGRAMIPTHNSLAYLVPVVRSGQVAIVSTANKALQEQLFYKDIPFIQQHIKDFDAALVKGMSNYICLDRFETERTGMQFYAKNRDFQRLVNVLNDPDPSFTGDFETLGFQLPSDIRSKVATDSDQCAWSKCNYFADCYVRQMRERAALAQIIVVNHTLLLLDAAIGGYLLPERDVIILDEAHHLEEEATRAFTITINPAQIQTLLAQRLLKDHTLLSLQDETFRLAQLMWQRLEQVANPSFKGRVNLELPLEEGLHLASIISDLADSLRKQRPRDLPEKEGQLYDKLLKRTQNLSENVRTVFSVAEPKKFVYYIERVEGSLSRGFVLQASAAPLDVTAWLKEKLFDKCNVICTSATLATIGPNPARPEDKGPNFAYFRRRVGLDPLERPDVLESVLPLSFDYESNALLYLPRDLPPPAYGPGSDDYMKAIAREMYKLVKISRGRAFLLFSSKRMLDRAYELMSPYLPYPLLKQGDMTRMELTRRFRQEEGAVLFGLKSFWEGVDITGEALSLVVIDKLPFDPPDDPVHEARVAMMKAAGENWFGTYVLPQAVLRLKQGLGRLLRSRDDRGVLAILDTRLHTKGYGKMVLNALPPARRTSNLRDVEIFFSPSPDK